MATYYVDYTAGNDGWPGTPGQPWKTLNKAATTAVAGDTCIFVNDTWDIGSGQSSWNSGTPGNWITFQAQNSRQANLEISSDGIAIEITNDNYIRFEGFRIKGRTSVTSTLVSLYNCSYIVFDDCDCYNTASRIIQVRNGSDNVTIQNCVLHNDVGAPPAPSIDVIELGAIGAVEDILIENTEIHSCPHSGIYAWSADGVTIRDCNIHNTQSHGISLGDPVEVDEPDNILIEGCIVRDCGNYAGETDPKRGIWLGNRARTVTIRQNDIYHCNGGAITVRDTNWGPISIYNNTIYDCDQVSQDWGSGFWLEEHPDADRNPSVEIKNNIVYHTNGATRTNWYLRSETHFNASIDYNLYYDSTAYERIYRQLTMYTSYANYQAVPYESNSVMSSDPLFNNPGAGDFTLKAASPAIDAGTDMGLPYWGSAPDIGAHEYRAGAIVRVTVVVVVAIIVVAG